MLTPIDPYGTERVRTVSEDVSSPYSLLSTSECRPQTHELARALQILNGESDVGCVVFSPGVLQEQELGAGVVCSSVVARTSLLQRLLQQDYQPICCWLEVGQALRLAGWRVVALNCNRFLEAPQVGRLRSAVELYDIVSEQELATGPRLLKRFLPWRLFRFAREQQSRPTKETLGYLWQTGLSSLRADFSTLREGRWRESELHLNFPQPSTGAAVIIFTANRPWHLRHCLDALHQYWPDPAPHLYISRDGEEPATRAMLESLGPEVRHLHFREPVEVPPRNLLRGEAPYFRIAQHYRFGLSQAFSNPHIDRVIILEDDMIIGPDFFPFMRFCTPVLQENPDLLAASAWNDHGHYARDPLAVHRTDCFPGCGWLITRESWEFLDSRWPPTHWDEWLRRPEVTQGRQFLRPEVNRIRNVGRHGTGCSQFYDRYIATLPNQAEPLDWEQRPVKLDYETYRAGLFQALRKSTILSHPNQWSQGNALCFYSDETQFQEYAEHLEILSEFRPDKPRASFEGIVILGSGRGQLYLVPAGLRDQLLRGATDED